MFDTTTTHNTSPSPEYSEQLVDLRVSVEERLLQNHLCKDARDAPDVDGAGVARRAEQNLGSSIPQSHHLTQPKEDRGLFNYTHLGQKSHFVLSPRVCRHALGYRRPGRVQSRQS